MFHVKHFTNLVILGIIVNDKKVRTGVIK